MQRGAQKGSLGCTHCEVLAQAGVNLRRPRQLVQYALHIDLKRGLAMSLPDESPSLNDQIDELIRHADEVRPLPPLPLIDYVDMALRHIVAKEDAEE